MMKRSVITLFAMLAAVSCSKTESYSTFSTRNRVFFCYEIFQSPFNQVTTPARFLSVRKSEGKLHMVDSDGRKYDMELSAVQNSSFLMGLAGLIIGTPTFNNDDMSVWAYDLGCPECNNPSIRLKFNLEGTASCSECEKSWSLNSSGFPVSGKARPLYRYPVTLNNGVLTVSN